MESDHRVANAVVFAPISEGRHHGIEYGRFLTSKKLSEYTTPFSRIVSYQLDQSVYGWAPWLLADIPHVIAVPPQTVRILPKTSFVADHEASPWPTRIISASQPVSPSAPGPCGPMARLLRNLGPSRGHRRFLEFRQSNHRNSPHPIVGRKSGQATLSRSSAVFNYLGDMLRRASVCTDERHMSSSNIMSGTPSPSKALTRMRLASCSLRTCHSSGEMRTSRAWLPLYSPTIPAAAISSMRRLARE